MSARTLIAAHARPGRTTFPWPTGAPTAEHRAAYAGAEPRPYWTAQLPERASTAELS